jgi:hypothetical protein
MTRAGDRQPLVSDLQRICAEMDPPIELLPTHVRKRPGQAQTHAAGAMQDVLAARGEAHLRFVLVTIVESENNRNALYGPLIWAISDRVIANPEWADTGSAWLEAFDRIDLNEVWDRARACGGATPRRHAASTILHELLRPIFGAAEQGRML